MWRLGAGLAARPSTRPDTQAWPSPPLRPTCGVAGRDCALGRGVDVQYPPDHRSGAAPGAPGRRAAGRRGAGGVQRPPQAPLRRVLQGACRRLAPLGQRCSSCCGPRMRRRRRGRLGCRLQSLARLPFGLGARPAPTACCLPKRPPASHCRCGSWWRARGCRRSSFWRWSGRSSWRLMAPAPARACASRPCPTVRGRRGPSAQAVGAARGGRRGRRARLWHHWQCSNAPLRPPSTAGLTLFTSGFLYIWLARLEGSVQASACIRTRCRPALAPASSSTRPTAASRRPVLVPCDSAAAAALWDRV